MNVSKPFSFIALGLFYAAKFAASSTAHAPSLVAQSVYTPSLRAQSLFAHLPLALRMYTIGNAQIISEYLDSNYGGYSINFSNGWQVTDPQEQDCPLRITNIYTNVAFDQLKD